MLNFCYMKIVHFLNPNSHQKIKGDILKNVQKTKCVSFNKIIMKMINENENEIEDKK